MLQYISLVTCDVTVQLIGYLRCYSTVHWLLGDYAQLDFVAQWFKQLSYLVVTHFFWTRAYRAIRREKLSVFCLLPGLVIGLIYCTVTLGLGIAYVNDYTDACLGEYISLITR